MRGLNLVYRHSIQKPLKLCIMLKHNKKKQSPLLHNISTLENECVFIIHQLYLKWLEKVKSWLSARPNFENFGVGHRIVFKHIYISFEIQCRKVNKLLINFPSLFQFTFTNSEWLEASFQKRECAKIIPSSKDPTRWGRNCIDFNRIANTFALSLYCVSSYYVNHIHLKKGLLFNETFRWQLKRNYYKLVVFKLIFC